MGFGLFGPALILPLFFQNVLGFTAFDTGFALLPGAIATAISMPIAGTHHVQLLDARASIAFGLAIFALGSLVDGRISTRAGFWDIFWPRVCKASRSGFCSCRSRP